MISSPVDRMATTGRRQTSTSATPIAASTPVSRLVSSLPGAQHGLAGRDVGAGERHAAAGADRAGDAQLAAANVGVLDHHDGVGAARHHAAGGNRQRLAATRLAVGRHHAGVDLLGAEPHRPRRFFGGAEGVFGHHREAVHVRAIERRHVHRRHDVGGEHASERRVERHALGAAGRQVEGGAEAALRLVAIEDLEELFLLRHRARRRPRRRPAKPSLSSPTITKPSARVVDDSTDAPPTASGSTAPSATVTRA